MSKPQNSNQKSFKENKMNVENHNFFSIQVCIQKPNTSRPANSERYLVCKGKREDSANIAQYMFEINARLNQVTFSYFII